MQPPCALGGTGWTGSYGTQPWETSTWPRPTACSPPHGPSASASTSPVPSRTSWSSSASAWPCRLRPEEHPALAMAGRRRPGRKGGPRGPLPPRLRALHGGAARRSPPLVGPTPIASCRARTISPSTSRTSRRSSSRASSAGPTKRSPGDAGRDVRLDPAGGLELHARRPRRGLGTAWTTLHLGYESEAGELLGIPDTVSQVALIPVAYYTGDTFKPGTRRPVEDHLPQPLEAAHRLTRARRPATRRVAALSGPA